MMMMMMGLHDGAAVIAVIGTLGRPSFLVTGRRRSRGRMSHRVRNPTPHTRRQDRRVERERRVTLLVVNGTNFG